MVMLPPDSPGLVRQIGNGQAADAVVAGLSAGDVLSMAQEDKQLRFIALNNSLANQSLAGLEVDAVVIDELQAWVRGEITIDEIITRLKLRIEAGEFEEGRD